MKTVRVLFRSLAAEILCLFINMTLAGSRSMTMRIVCLVCTVLILVTVLADFSITEAHDDAKQKRGKTSIFAAGGASLIPPFVSWAVLFISVKGRDFDFYRWHKLINAPFLQYYNLIESDATSAAISSGELMLMLLPIFTAPLTVTSVYFFVRKKMENETV